MGEGGRPFLPGVLKESRRRAALVAGQDRIVAKVSEFIREGMRAGRISDESGELLVAAAERAHAEALERLDVLTDLPRSPHQEHHETAPPREDRCTATSRSCPC